MLGKKENNQGDVVLSTSKELVISAGILKRKLGQRAQDVERRCAVIRRNQGNATREVGRSIRKILQCLDEGEPEQALVLATELASRNPKNGDTWCILARTHLSVKPPNFLKADDACSNALQYYCTRNELFDYVIESKKGIEDWQGLKSFTDGKRNKSTNKDRNLEAYLLAVKELIVLAKARGSFFEAHKHAMDGVNKISDKIQNTSLAPVFFTQLVEEQKLLADQAMRYRRDSIERPKDYLGLADLGFELADLNIQTKGVVNSISKGLTTWSEEVKKKEVLDEAEVDIIANNIRKLNRLKSLLQSSNRDITADLKLIASLERELGFLGASFS